MQVLPADVTLKVFLFAPLVMKTGSAINTALKALGAKYGSKTFSASATPPAEGTTTQLLSATTSGVDVLAWRDGTDIKYYAEGYTDSGVKIPLNANSSRMFQDCSGLSSLDVSDFNTGRVGDMDGMFSGCRSLTSLDLSGFNTGSVARMVEMFKDCNGLVTIYASESFSTDSVTNGFSMFAGCTVLNTARAPY